MTCSDRLFCEEDRSSLFFFSTGGIFGLHWMAQGKYVSLTSWRSWSRLFYLYLCVCMVAWVWGFPSWRTQKCLVLPLCPLSAFLLIDSLFMSSMHVEKYALFLSFGNEIFLPQRTQVMWNYLPPAVWHAVGSVSWTTLHCACIFFLKLNVCFW